MGDEPTSSGWLPPRAPGSRPAPRFEPAPPEPEHEPEAAAPAVPRAADRPAFVPARPQRSNGLATTSLVLGILGLLMLIPTAGAAFLFSLPCSIAAWITGAQGRRRVASGQADGGDGTAHAGVILGIVGVVLGVIGMVVWIVLIAAGLDLEELRRDLERQSNPDADQAARMAATAVFGR
jgi:hypothetical protein